MKKIILFSITLFATILLQAQVQNGINYQAAARDNAGNILANQAVSFRLAILQGSSSGSVVYQETHAVTTNTLGLVNLVIGTGTVDVGSYASVNWSNGPYFLQVEMAVGAGSFTLMGTSQFVSVPYALYAQHSGDRSKAGKGITISNDSIHSAWSYYGNDIATNNSGNVGIGVVPNNQKLEVNGGVAIGNTSNNAPGSMRFTGADFEGYTGANWRSFTKSSLDNFEYTNPLFNGISTSTRNTITILSTDSIVVPATGTYLIVYSGRGFNAGVYDITNTGIYDYEGQTGVVNITNSTLAFVGNQYTLPFARYQVNTPSATFFQFTPLVFNLTTYAVLNSGDVLKPGAIVNSTTPAPTANWQIMPFKIQLIKLN